MELEPGQATLSGILATPALCRAALRHVEAERDRLVSYLDLAHLDELLVTGCGSSLYLGALVAHYFQSLTGIPARVAAASELLLYPRGVLSPRRRPLLVAVSRSGETSETLAAAAQFHQQGGKCLAVTADPSAPLVARSGAALTLPEARSEGICMTGSFTALLLALQALVADAVGDSATAAQLRGLPDFLESGTARWQAEARRAVRGHRASHFVFLGQGPTYGLAQEGALKMTEMALAGAQAYPSLEYRHGPKAAADPNTLVVLLASPRVSSVEAELAREVADLGARVMVICDAWGPETAPPGSVVELHSGLSEPARVASPLPFLQLFSYHKALEQGRDPDAPRHLDRAVILEGAAF